MEEKPASAEETIETPAMEQPPAEPLVPSFREKLKANKFKILGGILGALVFAGAIFGAYKLGQKQVQPAAQPTPTPEVVATPTPDPTADWETYTNTKYGYSIKYPNTFLLPTEIGKSTTFLLANSTIPAEKAVYIFVEENPQKLDFLEWLRSSEVKQAGTILEPTAGLKIKEEMILEIKWLSFEESEMPLGFPPSGEIYWATLYKDKVFLVGLLNLNYQEYKPTVNLMLSTFRFLEISTPQPVSIPNDWQEYTATDPDFGIKTTLSLPPGFSFRFTGSEFTIQKDLDATELWDYSTSVFREKDGLKNYYTGESRRIWYQKFIEGEFWAEKPYQFVAGEITNVIEHQIGTQTHLELTVTGGPPTNYSGEVETHFIYTQNGIIHIIKPVSHKANSTTAQIPKYIGIIFFSLRSTQIK